MIKKYINFLTKATNQHGVHSPFVYSLITQCIYKKSPQNVKKEYNKHRNKLLTSNKIINITDLGAGSKIFKDSQRKVTELVTKVSISKKHGLLLNRLIDYLNINSVLELGTSVGLGTSAMCINNLNVKIDTIEGCKEILNVAKDNFKLFNTNDNIKTHQGNFTDILPNLLSNNKYDLIYFDGNHQKEPTLTYFKKCLKAKHNDSVFIFDDIYWSDEMLEAWEEVKNHEEVKVTIDLFDLGLVFFRKEQVKEHFKIRF